MWHPWYNGKMMILMYIIYIYTNHCPIYAFTHPDAPWCWNIYLHLSHSWGGCRQIFYTWSIWDFYRWYVNIPSKREVKVYGSLLGFNHEWNISKNQLLAILLPTNPKSRKWMGVVHAFCESGLVSWSKLGIKRGLGSSRSMLCKLGSTTKMNL